MKITNSKQAREQAFHSISGKIMMIMLLTITIFSVGVLGLNLTLLKHSRESLFYEQLKAAAEAKRTHDKEKLTRPELEDDIWVAHFFIQYSAAGYEVYKDHFTKEKYADETITQAIANETANMTPSQSNGKLDLAGKHYYFYREWLVPHQTAMIFFLGQEEEPLVTEKMIFFLVAAIGIAAISSKIIANGIAKQVKTLEAFAEEIARRNWEAPVPKMPKDEMGLLANSLETMRSALKIAEERDRKFLQSTSHDLKTPVMLIKGYAQAIVDGLEIEGEQIKAKVILDEAEKLENRIGQLLRLNTLDQSLNHTQEWQEIRLDRLLKSVVEKFKPLTPEIQWEMALEETLTVGNQESLLIAFENILDNQCRYAKRKIWIRLSKNQIQMGNDGEFFHTKDTQSLFEPLVKDENGQFGLGLAIVLKVMKSHQWTIEAKNLSEGVCFVIQIKNRLE